LGLNDAGERVEPGFFKGWVFCLFVLLKGSLMQAGVRESLGLREERQKVVEVQECCVKCHKCPPNLYHLLQRQEGA
jgi:hypothetical protein